MNILQWNINVLVHQNDEIKLLILSSILSKFLKKSSHKKLMRRAKFFLMGIYDIYERFLLRK